MLVETKSGLFDYNMSFLLFFFFFKEQNHKIVRDSFEYFREMTVCAVCVSNKIKKLDVNPLFDIANHCYYDHYYHCYGYFACYYYCFHQSLMPFENRFAFWCVAYACVCLYVLKRQPVRTFINRNTYVASTLSVWFFYDFFFFFVELIKTCFNMFPPSISYFSLLYAWTMFTLVVKNQTERRRFYVLEKCTRIITIHQIW